MKYFLLFIFFCLSMPASAEHLTNQDAGDNNQSASTRNANAVDTDEPDDQTTDSFDAHIQDPTQMTGSFEDALRRIQSSNNNSNSGSNSTLPTILVSGKTYSENGKHVSAILTINDQQYFVRPGSLVSFMQNNTIYEITVTKIDMYSIHVRLQPLNQTLILR